jgi:HlyD family secretion protein
LLLRFQVLSFIWKFRDDRPDPSFMNEDQLQKLRISSEQKRRSSVPLWLIIGGVLLITVIVGYFAIPRASDATRAGMKSDRSTPSTSTGTVTKASLGKSETDSTPSSVPAPAAASSTSGQAEGFVLTVSGYIIARERIEISPRFMGVVKWIGVKKGDAVTNGQVVVLLDDSEYRARLAEVDGQTAVAQVAVERAATDLKRAEELVRQKVEMQKMLDDAKLQLSSAEAQFKQVQGSRKLIETWLDWCVIRSPVNGVVLSRLVDANELVTPQTFGGTGGPSTSLLAVADLNDLQVETDVQESDLGKISLGQKCRVSPEAYPDKFYDGTVAEIAPEASRSKGTLQIKVQIEKPDRFLTPELSAKVEFLKRGEQ